MDSFRRDGLTFDVRDAGPGRRRARRPAARLPAGLRGLGPGGARRCTRPGCARSRPTSAATPPWRGRAAAAGYRLRETTADVLALLDAAGLESAHVVGHDWGGIVAWALAAWHPDRVRTLTALSVPHPAAMAKAMVTSDQALRSYYMRAVPAARRCPSGCCWPAAAPPLRRMLRGGGLPDEAGRPLRRPHARAGRAHAPRSAGTARCRWSGRDPVGTVRVPTLHVWSTGDAFLGRAGTEATAQFVDAPYRLEVLEGISHWIPELAPDGVAELVTAHVKKG